MKIPAKIQISIALVVLSTNLFASLGVQLEKARTDINNKVSLQNGAKLFMNYCSGCHAISFMRYNRIGSDLGLSDADIEENLMFASDKVGENIKTAMSAEDAANWFGIMPPDLSLISRSRGNDWVYTYLKGFYADESRVFGVNNRLLNDISMPDALWSLREGRSADDFNKDVRDITNFLDYVGEPAQLVRYDIGKKVLFFLAVLLVLSYLLKKEYWKDVKYGMWRKRD